MKKADWKEFGKHCARPERICWAVAEHDGQRSICPLGWKMNTSISPPMMAVSVAPSRFTHDLIVNAGEFVLAWPGEDLDEATLFCGTRSGRDVDKFKAMNLTPATGEVVKAPLVEECVANLECKLAGQMTTGDHTVFAGEIVAVWLHDSPKRCLCSVDRSSGYDFLLEKGGYRFGVVKA
jgi:flavin reductase (DIM6/NTAB) family NADH-FMN oxidoreductase RutF